MRLIEMSGDDANFSVHYLITFQIQMYRQRTESIVNRLHLIRDTMIAMVCRKCICLHLNRLL